MLTQAVEGSDTNLMLYSALPPCTCTYMYNTCTHLHGVGAVQHEDDLVLRDGVHLKLRVECQHAGLGRGEGIEEGTNVRLGRGMPQGLDEAHECLDPSYNIVTEYLAVCMHGLIKLSYMITYNHCIHDIYGEP